MTKLSNPTPIFYDGAGNLLDGGYIYIGVENADPQVQPINLFWDAGRTIPAAQPLRTIGGVIVNGANPSDVFFAEADFSTRILDGNEAQVTYSPSTHLATTDYQPLDADLTAIAAAGTTPFGIGLLSLANAGALQALAGTAGALQKTGGTMTGAINQQGAGSYLYFGDSGRTGGRVYVTVAGAPDPTTQPGDIWLELAS